MSTHLKLHAVTHICHRKPAGCYLPGIAHPAVLFYLTLQNTRISQANAFSLLSLKPYMTLLTRGCARKILTCIPKSSATGVLHHGSTLESLNTDAQDPPRGVESVGLGWGWVISIVKHPPGDCNVLLKLASKTLVEECQNHVQKFGNMHQSVKK